MLSDNWHYTPASLVRCRQERHAASCELIRRNHILERSLNGEPRSAAAVDFLTIEEAHQYSFYIQLRIQNLCKALQFPAYVTATALSFFKRFYVAHSIMDHDPRVVFPTVVFLASKSENMHVTADEVLKKTSQPTLCKEAMAEMELVIVKALRFEFLVQHPYSALYGLFLEAQKLTDKMDLLYDAYKESYEQIHLSCLTDVQFFFSPSQVAYAVFFEACAKYQIDISRLLDGKYTMVKIGRLQSAVAEISSSVKHVAKLNKDQITLIDRKLRFCHNPAFDPKSKLFAAIQEQKEKKLEESFLSKQAAVKKEVQEQDPF